MILDPAYLAAHGLLTYIAHYFIARGLFQLFGRNWPACIVIGALLLVVLHFTRRRRYRR